jgi:hypothetical protein
MVDGPYKLTTEQAPPECDVTLEDVERGVAELASPQGPTYIILESGDGSYVQAAGTNDRYVVEARDVYGEGFRHWRAFHPGSPTGSTVTIGYRQRCPKGEHPPRSCPLTVRREEVMRLADVLVALTAYFTAGTRSDEVGWRDVSDEFLAKADEREIRSIQPSGRVSDA